MQNYRIEYYSNIDEWLAHRKIGGTELVNLIAFKSKYSDILTLYDRLINNQKSVKKTTSRMSNGKKAEKHIKELFLIENKNYKETFVNENKIMLVVRNDFEELTLSPDCLIEDVNTNQAGFIEIKYIEINSENDIQEYMCNLKEKAPHYYWQCIHYFIVKDDIMFGQFVVAFHCRKEQRIVIESLKLERSEIKQDIELGETKAKDFILNNLRVKKRPQTILENQEKGENIEWMKLSNIAILRK